MQHTYVPLLPTVPNICGQILREIPRGSDHFSGAHVLTNPGQSSDLHMHKEMYEVYIILRGDAILEVGDTLYRVKPGVVQLVGPGVYHRLSNDGLVGVEYLVLASPPFDPKDVHMHPNQKETEGLVVPAPIPPLEESVADGALVSAQTLRPLNMSVAFGRVTNEIERRKKPHYHDRTGEWVYVIEGSGSIKTDAGEEPIKPGDWTAIEPGDSHTLRNDNAQDMVAVCICHPAFDPADLLFR